jgi:hypothetical protein
MDDGVQRWRQERLKALAAKIGSKAELGRLLGYRDGAFVGQMLAGIRPITEKTVQAAEKLRGPNGESFRGWFSRAADGPPPPPATGFNAPPSPEELELLDNFRHMLDRDREELAEEIAKRAERAKADIADYLRRMGITPKKQKETNH